MVDNPNALLENWLHRVKKAQSAYTKSATSLEKIHYLVGGSVILLSTLSASLLLATSSPLKTLSGFASIAAAILAGFQTFYRLSERAEKFRQVGAKYSELRIEIEQKIAFLPQGKELEQCAESVLEKWKRIREDAPPAIQKIWDKVNVK